MSLPPEPFRSDPPWEPAGRQVFFSGPLFSHISHAASFHITHLSLGHCLLHELSGWERLLKSHSLSAEVSSKAALGVLGKAPGDRGACFMGRWLYLKKIIHINCSEWSLACKYYFIIIVINEELETDTFCRLSGNWILATIL